MKSYMARKEDLESKWYVVDAENATLGRLASRIALVLMGKNTPRYTRHVDTGSFVIVVNADKVKLTGKKRQDKIYYRYTGYQGGLREINAAKLLETHPERVITKAVQGMLPKTSLGRQMFRKLKVYAGPDHKHGAQKPESISLT
ncbi:MAG: 50S ribosomal protein L13 [bacterium]|nr:50S ribosomal protein L13 [bacterium]